MLWFLWVIVIKINMEAVIFIILLYGIPSLIVFLVKKRHAHIEDKVMNELFSLDENNGVVTKSNLLLKNVQNLKEKAENELGRNVLSVSESKGLSYNRCPICKSGYLVNRTCKFGKFVACSAYPNCKYTLNNKSHAKEINQEIIENIHKAYSYS